MKRFYFKKPMVESPYPPKRVDVLWVDVNETNGKVISIKEFKNNKWTSLLGKLAQDSVTDDSVINLTDVYKSFEISSLISDYQVAYISDKQLTSCASIPNLVDHTFLGNIGILTYDSPVEVFSLHNAGMDNFNDVYGTLILPKVTKEIRNDATYGDCWFFSQYYLPEGIETVNIRPLYMDCQICVFPSTTKIIHDYAPINTVICKAINPPQIASYAFEDIRMLNSVVETIYVPAESVEAYKTATNWTKYADKIKPYVEN